MHAEARNITSHFADPEVVISHVNCETGVKEELVFSVTSLGRPTFNEYDMFKEINNYWENLDTEKQQEIFNIYKAILGAFNSNWDNGVVREILSKEIVKLIDAHPLSQVYQWIAFRSDIIVPAVFNNEYTESIDCEWTREQTYIRSDYLNLISLALTLRVMIPIWGEYITRYRKEHGTDFKEYYAFQLLNRSSILKTEAFEKLKLFISMYLEKIEQNTFMVIKGISSDDFPTWILAVVTIKGICVGDIRGIETKSHLVAYISQLIKQKTARKNTSVESIIKAKEEKRVDEGDPAVRLSVLEAYKGKYIISVGEISEIEHMVSDTRACAFRLSKGMSEELYNRAMATSHQLIDKSIIEPQIMLAQWVFKPIVPSRGLLYLQKTQIVEILGVTQAVLWARGHYFLSIIATCYPDQRHQDDSDCLWTMDTRTKISKDTIMRLNEIFPYVRPSTIKKQSQKQPIPAMAVIDDMTTRLASSNWLSTADDQFLIDVFGSAVSRRIPAIRDLKSHIAMLIVEIGSRTWI